MAAILREGMVTGESFGTGSDGKTLVLLFRGSGAECPAELFAIYGDESRLTVVDALHVGVQAAIDLHEAARELKIPDSDVDMRAWSVVRAPKGRNPDSMEKSWLIGEEHRCALRALIGADRVTALLNEIDADRARRGL